MAWPQQDLRGGHRARSSTTTATVSEVTVLPQIVLAVLMVPMLSLPYVAPRWWPNALLWPWYAAILLAQGAVFILGTDAHLAFKVALAGLVAFAIPAMWWVDPVRKRRLAASKA